MSKLTSEQENNLIIEYQTSQIPILDLCKKYNICLNDFYELKQRKNLSTRSRKNCNENFFETLDTENSAYWAGFILGGRYINNDKIIISLPINKLSHLQKFKENIKAENSISIFNENKSCIITLCKEKLIEDLNKYEIISNNHFIRGIFDATGDFKNGIFSIFFPTKEFLEKYQDILIINCKISKVEVGVNKYESLYELKYENRTEITKIVNYLYKDASIYIEQDYQILNIPKVEIEKMGKRRKKKKPPTTLKKKPSYEPKSKEEIRALVASTLQKHK